jgi:hypothetical protein
MKPCLPKKTPLPHVHLGGGKYKALDRLPDQALVSFQQYTSACGWLTFCFCVGNLSQGWRNPEDENEDEVYGDRYLPCVVRDAGGASQSSVSVKELRALNPQFTIYPVLGYTMG